MQREDVERLAHRLDRAMLYLPDGDTTAMGEEAAAALRVLLDRAERADAERAALQGQLDDLRNGWANSVKAHAARLAERDAAFAAGQESMRERAEELYASDDEWDYFHAFVYRLRALPLKDSP